MRFIALVFAFLANQVNAHELWIEPTDYQFPADTIATANLVNGENFEGTKLAYLPRYFERFVAVNGGQFTNIEGRIGDTPAMKLRTLGDGLHVIAFLSRVQTISYENWEKFQRFVDHKDLGDAQSAHSERGLPEMDFSEAYIRYSKSLIGIGTAEGADRRLGLETELVALTNPYLLPTTEMRLQLFYKQDVRADEQIEIYEKAPDGSVGVALYRTNNEGIATIPVKPGHSYMADAVVLREPSEKLAADTGAVWETLWANLTWGMPE